jgi:hypothetical protein
MVAPLIAGAVRVARTKSSLKKVEKAKIKKNPIAQQRKERMYAEEALHNRPRKRHPSSEEKREENVRRVRDVLPYRKALQTASKGAVSTKIKTVKAFNRGIMTLGSVLYPMVIQIMFALLALMALAVDDSWWGWIDVIDASLVVATISWAIALLLGTYSMFIASFMMAKYLTHWKVVLAFIFCFSANWVPGLQIVPWVGIWILYIIMHEKNVHTQ